MGGVHVAYLDNLEGYGVEVSSHHCNGAFPPAQICSDQYDSIRFGPRVPFSITNEYCLNMGGVIRARYLISQYYDLWLDKL